MNITIPPYVKLILRVFLASLITMSFFRGLLFILIKINWTHETNYSMFELVQAFIFGLRYDIVITGYALFFPFLILGLTSFFYDKIRLLAKSISIYLFIVYTIIILIFCSDIPYFLHYFSRLTTASLLWFDDSQYMVGMILHERSFVLYLIIFFLLTFLIFYYFSKENKNFLNELSNLHNSNKKRGLLFRIPLFLILGTSIFIGIRGRLNKKSPIRIGTAYFCDNQVLNKLGLNPVFSFCHSFINDLKEQDKINLMNDEDAVQLASSFLKIPNNDSASIEIISKWEKQYGKEIIENNVVFIIMESMGTFKLGKYHGPKNLTPNLNSIISSSLYFDNIYTAGIHTFNGIYSTLFSFPTLYKEQPLEELMDVPHTGIAQVLKNLKYSTLFFTNHDPQFDNVSGFLIANGYDKIYSELDYPKNWIKSANGVPDHKMFEFAIPTLNNLYKDGKHFFAVFMTTSDHKPYILPDDIDFKPKSEKLERQMTEYADWSIGKFLEQASILEWYNNTTFVFIADHGLNMGHTYDMPLSFHHTPLIIYTPSSTPIYDTLHNLGGQIDVAPTILGLLNIPFVNTSLGINLFKNKRPFMYFCADDKIGCLDNEYYLIIRPENNETLYRYEHLEKKNYIDLYKSKVDSMKQYAYSMLQTAQVLRTEKLLLTKNKRH